MRYTPTYNDANMLTADGRHYTYTYDMLGRVVTAKDSTATTTIKEYKWDPACTLLAWREDVSVPADGLDGSDAWYYSAASAEGQAKLEIAQFLGLAKSTVEHWVYAYRDRGIDALAGKPRRGGVPKIRGEHAELLKRRIDAGPTPSDKVCTTPHLRGKDLKRIAREELGIRVGLSSVYRTLERMGYSCLAPRPRHEKQDLAAQKKFKEEHAPLL